MCGALRYRGLWTAKGRKRSSSNTTQAVPGQPHKKIGLRAVTQQQAGRPQATIQHGSLRLATLNVRGLSGEGRLEELAAELNSAGIGIYACCKRRRCGGG